MAPTTIGPNTVATGVIEQATQLPYQRKSFFAEGRHWAFFIYGAPPEMVYSSSLDGITWTTPTSIRAAEVGSEFSIWLQLHVATSTYYVHYAYSDSVGGGALYYRRGTVNADGTITWSPEQIAAGQGIGFEYESIGITMDWGANVYICFTTREIANPDNCIPWVTQSVTSPTWSTSPGYPYMLSAVQDASWTVIIVPFSTEVMTIYATDGGDIVYRVLAAGVWGAQTDSGFDIISSIRMSAATEYFTGASPVDAHLVFQDTSEDLIHASYNLGWSAGHTILTAADPLAPVISIQWWGVEDGANFRESQMLYCFWFPLTADPTANTVTYRVSRDEGVTWTNEAGGAASVEWLDETAEGFANPQIGSCYYSAGWNMATAQTYIGVLYTNLGASPDDVRYGALEFEDPDVDLLAGFWVSPVYDQELLGKFIVRQSSPEDVGAPDLYAKFSVVFGSAELLGEFESRQAASEELLGEFNALAHNVELLGIFQTPVPASQELLGEFEAQGAGSEELLGTFEVRRSASEELLGIFLVRHADLLELLGEFGVSRDNWITQGVTAAVYQALGIIS